MDICIRRTLTNKITYPGGSVVFTLTKNRIPVIDSGWSMPAAFAPGTAICRSALAIKTSTIMAVEWQIIVT